MKKLIENQFIQGSPVIKARGYSLEKIRYKDIHYGFRNNYYSDDCFKEKTLFFTEHITDTVYQGNELFFYPELAKQIRKLEAYPLLNKSYPIDQEKKGIEFLAYLAQYANECLQAFKAERLEKYKELNHLIYLYGHDRYLPLIQKLEEEKEERRYYPYQILTINNVKWYIDDSNHKNLFTQSIDLRKLFEISNHYRYVIVDQILSGTPFLALKCCTHEYNKGHVFWYNLSTLEKTTKVEAKAWIKPVQ